MPDSKTKPPQTISSVKLLICNTLKQQGFDPTPLCKMAGLSMPDTLRPIKRDEMPRVAHLMQLAAEITDEPDFALQVASRISITTFSSCAAVIIANMDLKSALRRAQMFSELIPKSACYEIAKEGDNLTARSLTASKLIPLEVQLQQLMPENTEPYTALFGCPVFFGQTENSISLREEDLSSPIAAQDIAVKDLSKLMACTIAEEVCVRIENSLAEGEPKITAIASGMGLSTRSLQRKLAAEKQTFAQILDVTRKRLAHEIVLKPSKQIKNLAFDLGFSDQSNFNRAFKRWFAVSPTEYRRQFGND